MHSNLALHRAAGVATIAAALAIAISGVGIVRAEHARPDNKTFSCSKGTACLKGNASGATDGVYGSATGNGTHGVYGTSNYDGVAGYTSSTTGGSGVAGVSTNESGSANGVYGKSSNGLGVNGTSSTWDGVEGVTDGGYSAVHGLSKGDGAGVFAESNDSTGNYVALEAIGDDEYSDLFYADNPGGSCFIDAVAYLTCTGGISGSVLRVRHRNSNGQRVLTYAAESASATIEDAGTGRMSGGVANIQIDPALASVMDPHWYYVFLTPLADTRGLYVSMKTATAFQVREAEHGRSSAPFNYRIVAHPLDAKNDRLPLAPAMQRLPLRVRLSHD